MAVERDRHLFSEGRKRVLALDGGGVRGLIILGVLVHVERELARRSRSPDDFRLAHYFDLIGGTSVGALIAALLSFGLPVNKVVDIFFVIARDVFQRGRILGGLRSKFDSAAFDVALERVLDDVVGAYWQGGRDDAPAARDITLDSQLLQTGLAIVVKRADSNSVWVLTNNPRSKYWAPDGPFWSDRAVSEREYFVANRDYCLLAVLRASASAPYYFDPIEIEVANGIAGAFIDGGASAFNNPAQELLLMTALRAQPGCDRNSPTGFAWQTGADKLLMLSVGTGRIPTRRTTRTVANYSAVQLAFDALHGIIDNASEAATAWMQAVSRTVEGEHVDSNLQRLEGLTIVPEPLLTYSRLNPELTANWMMSELGPSYNYLPEWIDGLHDMTNAERSNLNRCFEVGLGLGENKVRPELFPADFDIDETDGDKD